MTTQPPIAVTGATGVVGGMVARELAARGVAQRLLVRDPSRAPQLPESSVHRIEYRDRDAARNALEGIDTVFMVSAAETVERREEHAAFVDAAEAAGVRHIVYTSFFAAAPDAIFTLARDHYATEEHIKASGLEWTFLRDNLYTDFIENMVGEDGVIRGPAGDGRVSIVARVDVARSAVAVLGDPASHADRRYDLTGPEAITLAEAAATIARVRGRDVRFENETIDEAFASRARYGAPDWQVEAWVSTYTAIASGALAPVSADVEALTGAEPVSLEAFLRGGGSTL
ncbi:SDR family oxidoreductase [Herbiconiux sp. CPCC 205763]|uniref:SDR family oxidoreductase n=1 Tax=Herbiconiux aconitum TaxID=2970913 RepID=A0ABT2GT83_9MICO|nr:SDR family oxidoreductase [Herbiconiux aconitum]MCS5719358.1 SDR family oxidoreductase [Herbiconiux aconitum]